MRWFMNMRIAAKLMTGFAAVALIAAVVGVIGIRGITSVNKADTRMYAAVVDPYSDVVEMAKNLQRSRVSLLDLITSTSTLR